MGDWWDDPRVNQGSLVRLATPEEVEGIVSGEIGVSDDREWTQEELEARDSEIHQTERYADIYKASEAAEARKRAKAAVREHPSYRAAKARSDAIWRDLWAIRDQERRLREELKHLDHLMEVLEKGAMRDVDGTA